MRRVSSPIHPLYCTVGGSSINFLLVIAPLCDLEPDSQMVRLHILSFGLIAWAVNSSLVS